MPDEADEVRDLRAHVDAAHAAADRLVRDAQARAERSDEAYRERLGSVPERGWEVPDEHKPSDSPSELQIAVNLLASLRDALPVELSQQLAEAVRELLVAVRALIDWYLERLKSSPPGSGDDGPERVENIPIT